MYTEWIHAINGATATTTSAAINVEDAEKITLFFIRTNHSAGKTVFTVDGSPDGTTYVTYNKLIDNVANSNSQTLTRVASYDTGTANGAKFYSISPEDCFKWIRVTATETTDGTHDAWVGIQYGSRK